MAVAWNKASLFFSDGRYGWTEQYWSTTQEELTATLPKAIILAGARQTILAQGANPCNTSQCAAPRLQYIRISQLGLKRSTIFATPSGDVLGTLGGTSFGSLGTKLVSANPVSSEPPDNPYSAVGLIGNLTGGGKSKRALSGLPDGFICDQSLQINDPVVGFIRRFTDYLSSGPWGALSILGPESNRTIPQGTPPSNTSLANAVAILSVTQNAQGQPVVTLAAGLQAGTNCCTTNRVTITCYQPNAGTPTINGTYQFSANPAVTPVTVITLKKVFKPLSAFCLGFAVPYQPQVLGFTSFFVSGPTKRDRGTVPFARPRGRARKRA